LACNPFAPRAAREFAHRVVIGSVSTVEVIELLVSELVTNAVVHVGSPVDLTIRHLGNRIRVEVSDAGVQLPEMRPATIEHCRGMHIVAALAARWGIDGHVGGKTVWFEVEDR
jgi:anti-sigma regulatory factor (Ser/Thr protein kinase)